MIPLLLTALLHIWPSPARRCMERRFNEIAVATANAEIQRVRAHRGSPVEEIRVPAGLLMSIGYLETHLGCSHASGGNWGAPISRNRRDVAGGPFHAAHALAWSYVVCNHNWRRAVMRFRTGYCVFHRRLIGYTPDLAIWLTGRIYDLAEVPRPENLQ